MTLKSIAIICFENPLKVTGGVQRRISAEIAYLSKKNLHLTIIYSGKGAPIISGNIHYIPVSVPKAIYPIQTLLFSIKVARLFRQLPQFDLIETHHDSGAAVILSSLIGKKIYKVWVEFIHGVFLDEFYASIRFEPLITKLGLRYSALLPLSIVEKFAAHHATAVITVSNYSSNKIQHLYGITPSKIHIIPNGINTKIYYPNSGPIGEIKNTKDSKGPVFLYVGRLDPRKGVLVLLRAFAKARAELPSIELEIIGRGLQQEQIVKESQRLLISDAVHFRGNKSDQEIVDAYRTAYSVCMPSLQEGQGIVALEAQACGTPVIASYVGGLPEVVINNSTGILVPPGEVESLARAIIKLFSNINLRNDFAFSGSEWAKSFNWDNLISKQYDLYEALLSLTN